MTKGEYVYPLQFVQHQLHLLAITTIQKHKKNRNFNITLDTGSEIIKPIDCEKLLGGHITNNFKWNQHKNSRATSMTSKT